MDNGTMRLPNELLRIQMSDGKCSDGALALSCSCVAFSGTQYTPSLLYYYQRY